jgi:hypothetical protein
MDCDLLDGFQTLGPELRSSQVFLENLVSFVGLIRLRPKEAGYLRRLTPTGGDLERASSQQTGRLIWLRVVLHADLSRILERMLETYAC